MFAEKLLLFNNPLSAPRQIGGWCNPLLSLNVVGLPVRHSHGSTFDLGPKRAVLTSGSLLSRLLEWHKLDHIVASRPAVKVEVHGALDDYRLVR